MKRSHFYKPEGFATASGDKNENQLFTDCLLYYRRSVSVGVRKRPVAGTTGCRTSEIHGRA
jgi:hypothetical protein